MKIRIGAVLLALDLACAASGAWADQVVLRVVPHADLKILDPHTNTAPITLMHGLMIYDTLFSLDEKQAPRPQMVGTETVSPDKLVYNFTLRPGLKFHDGQPVTSRDVVASPSGLAGGKVVKVDRVEFVVLPDGFTKSGALQRGEVDMIDQLPHDQVPILEKSPGVVLRGVTQLDYTAAIRPNSLYPPFNDQKARQALALIVSQADYLSAAYGDPHWWRTCYGFFVCGSPNETEAGSEAYRQPDLARAKALFAEAGYKGEKIRLINTHEISAIGALGDVTAATLKEIGVNVEIADSDWGTMLARRAKKEPPAEGGWNLFHTGIGGGAMYSPITNFAIDSSCDGKNWFGWPCDEETQKLRQAYVDADDEETRRNVLVALETHLWQAAPIIPLGQEVQPFAWRDNVTGVLRSNFLVFWNITKS